jgi:hypothetical protein
MTGISKNVRDRGSDDAGTDVSEASETDVSGERTDISERRIQRDALAKHPRRRPCEIGWRRDATCGTKSLLRSRAARDAAGRRKITEHRQRDLPCPALFQKIFRFRRRANQFYQLAPSHPGKRGVSRSSRTREGMRWTQQRRRAR